MTALYAVAFLSSLGFCIVIPLLALLVMRLGGNAFVLGALGAALLVLDGPAPRPDCYQTPGTNRYRVTR